MTRLSATLPLGDSNGLAALDPQFVANPRGCVVAVVLLDTRRIITDADSGESVPVLRIRRIEPIVGTDADLAAQLMRRAVEERTGQQVLPLGMENEIEALLADVDTDDGDDEP